MTENEADTVRAEQIGRRLGEVRQRITDSVRASRREDQPELIVVTKYFPADDVRILAGLGVVDVAENRDQEAAAKAAETADCHLRWHFVGQLQRNKARSVLRYASAVHSIDRVSLVTALGKAMDAEQESRSGHGIGTRPDLLCYIQVNLDEPSGRGGDGGGAEGGDAGRGKAGRGGADPQAVSGIAQRIMETDGLILAGVMAVAPRGMQPERAFGRLAGISGELVRDYPAATGISAGMSADLEAAVGAGATHLRIGSDVLGVRPALG